MNKQFRLGLLLTLSLLPPPRMATAQQRFNHVTPPPLPVSNKQSHREVPGFDLSNAQEIMAERLRELHELHQLQDQVQELLKDQEFLDHMKQFAKEDLQKLREKIHKREGLSQDPNWNSFLEQSAAWQKLRPEQIEMLRRFAKRSEQISAPSGDSGSIQDRGPAASSPNSVSPSAPPTPSPSPPPPTGPSPEPSLLDRMQEESTKWLMENFDEVGGSMLDALTQVDGSVDSAPLAELLRAIRQPDFAGMDLSKNPLVTRESIGALTNSLSGVGDFLMRQDGVWNELRFFLRDMPAPSLPHLGGPSVSVPAASAPSEEGWVPALFSLLMLGTIVFLLCKKGFGAKLSAGSGAGAEWRLGSWPVSPSAVSTRQDVIRAFEYLALLCLGTPAAACHHRELGQRLAEAPPYPPRSGGDMGGPGRRQAAEMLAWLYEQARYAPAGETLSHEQISDARHALCLLAGVTAL